MSDKVISALRAQIAEAETKSQPSPMRVDHQQREIEITEDHPKVQEIITLNTNQMLETFNEERESHFQKVHELESELQHAKFDVQNS